MVGYVKENRITYTQDFKKITDIEETILGCLKIKDGVEVIGNKACQYGNFSEVDFPDSLKLIGRGAFFNSRLEYIEINKDVELSPHAFSSCNSLCKAIIRSEYIPDYCFSECSLSENDEYYMDFILENTIKIGNFAFNSGCIDKLSLPNTLKSIGEFAFFCTQFKDKTLILPEGLEDIENCAFTNSGLTDIYLPKSIKFVYNSILEDNITLHIYEESVDILGKSFCSNENVKVLTLEELLRTHTFKEINNDKIKFEER